MRLGGGAKNNGHIKIEITISRRKKKRNEKEKKEIKKTKVTKSYYIVHSHFSKCLHVYVVHSTRVCFKKNVDLHRKTDLIVLSIILQVFFSILESIQVQQVK